MAHIAIAVGPKMLKYNVDRWDLACIQDIVVERLARNDVIPFSFESHDDIGTRWTNLVVSRATPFYFEFHDTDNELPNPARKQSINAYLNAQSRIQVNIAGNVFTEDRKDLDDR